MLRKIIDVSLRFRFIIVAVAALVTAAGIYEIPRMSLDVFPDFVPPQVTIQTETPGLAPEQVEQLVTTQIEAAVSGAADIDSVKSESIEGLSVVTVIFAEGSDILADRQLLTERITEVTARLPKEAKAPTLSPLVSSTMDLLKIGLTSEESDGLKLRSFADWQLVPALRAVSGVAEVSVVGGGVKQMQIRIDPERLAERGVPLAEIIRAAADATGTRGTGYLETLNQRLLISSESPAADPATLAATIIRGSGADAIRLGDVAEVTLAAGPKFGDALIMGKPGVLLALTSQHGANTLEVTRRVEKALGDFKDVFEKEHITLHGALHRPANFIELALVHIRDSLLAGGVLVAIVLLVFLRNPRTALISFASIPLSLMAAVLVFRMFGATLNTMTLGGFAVAIGVVVDDAIIDVENIVRRLQLNAAADHPLAPARVILEASLEVRSAIVYATLIVMAAFIPVFLLGGIQGRFFLPLGIAFVLATLLSLVVAVTVTPALCSLFLGRSKPDREPFYLNWLKSLHVLGMRFTLRFPLLCSLAVVAAGGMAVLLGGRMKSEFLPEFREGHFVVSLASAPGTSLTEMNRLGQALSKELLADPRIQSVEQQAGRSEQGVDTWGPERAELHVELKPDPNVDEAAVQEDLRTLTGKYPGLQSEVLTFLGDRIGESIGGETAAGIVNLYGTDLDALEAKASEIGAIVGKVAGTTDVIVKAAAQSPRLTVRLKAGEIQHFGLGPADVMTAIQTATEGAEISQIYEKGETIPVVVVGGGPESPVGVLGSLPLVSPSGVLLRLSDVATIEAESGHATVEHESGRRRQVVTFNVKDKSISEVMPAVQQAISQGVKLDKGMQVTYSGAADAQAEANRNLVLSSVLALIVVMLLLWMAFRSGRNVALVLLNLPFALIGGVFLLSLSGLPVSLGALVGLVALFGISARNAIMMLSHYEHLVKLEKQPWSRETVIQGTVERLIPVLMTALVTALALAPIALKPGSAGQEIEGPMAIVILGGLVSSTLLTLLLLPALALKFGSFGIPEAAPDADGRVETRTALTAS